MAVSLTDLAVELYLVDTWVDIQSDVMSPISVSWGINGNGPVDRTASPGTMKFKLKNPDGRYSPNHASCTVGFKSGILVRLKCVYDGVTHYKFYGRVTAGGIYVAPGQYGPRYVEVTAYDWFEQVTNYKISLPTLTTNKTAAETVALIVANMSVPPLSTEYNECQSIFPNVFDTVKAEKTTALSEGFKAVMSELGAWYLRHSGATGELMVVDGRYTRSDRNLQAIPSVSVTREDILDTDGGQILGTDSAVLVDAGTSFFAALGTTDMPVITALTPANGKHTYNQIKFTTYPRYIDTTPQVLYSLNSYIALGVGETRENILGQYRDPTGGAARISGQSMISPLATTDYLMFANSDGTGTNLTANLVVTANYGSEGVRYTLQNTGATAGYVTKLQARGYGIYTYDPLTQYVEDAASLASYGPLELMLDMKYEQNLELVAEIASIQLDQYAQPKDSIESISFIANSSEYAMNMFLYLDVGMRIQVMEPHSAVSGDYFIQSVAFNVTGNEIITVSYMLMSGTFDNYTFWELGIDGSTELGETTVLAF